MLKTVMLIISKLWIACSEERESFEAWIHAFYPRDALLARYIMWPMCRSLLVSIRHVGPRA